MANVELDHVILLTPRLDAAVRAFELAGFTVFGGGQFPPSVPLHNALVVFQNDLYIELLGVRSPLRRLGACGLRHIGLLEHRLRERPLAERRILALTGQPAGFADLCVRVSDIELEALPELSRCRWETCAMQRATPSGALAEWDLAFPEDVRLPFVIRDRTPREVRIPPAPRHPNALGTIDSLECSIFDLRAVAPAYQRLFGYGPEEQLVSREVTVALSERSTPAWPHIDIKVTLGTPQSHDRQLDTLTRRWRGLKVGGSAIP